jgi:transcriptional regulator with XRE-family HTH domain
VTRYGTQPILAVLVLNDLSVSRVARAVGVPQRTLSRYVMGATRPHPEVVRRLVVCLDRPAELLFTSDAAWYATSTSRQTARNAGRADEVRKMHDAPGSRP